MEKSFRKAGAALRKRMNRNVLLMLFAAVFSLLLIQAGSVSSAEPQGVATREGNSVWQEAAGVGLLNITPETTMNGNEVDFDFTKKSNISADMQIAFIFSNDEGFVDSIEAFRTLQKIRTAVNTSSRFNETNSSYYDIIANISEEHYEAQEWVTVPTSHAVINGKEYYTTSFNAGEAVKAKPMAKMFGGLVKYSVAAKPASEDWQSPTRIEIDPIINATAANITSNSDLNLSASEARFADGKLVMAAGNRSTLTAWDTFADLEFYNNPSWTVYRGSSDAGSTVSARADSGFLNLTSYDSGASEVQATAMRTGNLSLPSSGLTITADVNLSQDTSSLNGNLCFVFDFDKISNSTNPGQSNCGFSNSATGNWLAFQHVGSGGAQLDRFTGGSRTTLETLAAANTLTKGWAKWILKLNASHAQACYNDSLPGGKCTAIYDYATGTSIPSKSGGQIVVGFYNNAGGTKALLFTNITAANTEIFGLPYNLTNARFQTNILNSTAGIGSARISNQTAKHANTAASFFTYDYRYQNQQSIEEGSFNSIGPITGIGINGTFMPTGTAPYTATELTSILVEWSSTFVAASEEEGDDAIKQGIDSTVPSATKYTTQKVYVVNASNSQWQGTVDYLIVQNTPPRRWLLNYITAGESYLNAINLSNIVYVLELTNKSTVQIESEIARLINETKS